MGIHFTTPPIMYKPKKKAPKKILMKKKYSMALTNITSLLYKVHKNTRIILHYNNLCTRLLYQHQLSRAYNCSKNASEKKISKADKLEEEKKPIPTVETLHLMSTDFIKFPHME